MAAAEENRKARILKKIENESMTPSSCKNDMSLFNQYTGQCWNDASMAFLLFMKRFGVNIQNIFLKYPEERVGALFQKWLTENKVKVDSIAEFEIPAEDYEQFMEAALDYLICLHRRYTNYKKKKVEFAKYTLQDNMAKATRAHILRRCDSYIFSICQEGSGIWASEFLHQKKIGIKKEDASRPFKNQIKNLLENEGREVEKYPILQFVSKRGYSLAKSGKLIAVLLTYFLSLLKSYDSGNILVYSSNLESFAADNTSFAGKYVFLNKNTDSIEDITMPAVVPEVDDKEVLAELEKVAEAEAAELSDENFEKMLKQINSRSNYSDLGNAINVNVCHSIPSEVQYSVTLSVKGYEIIEGGKPIGPMVDGTSHAICFLGCTGTNLIYDDNLDKVIPLDWRKIVTPEYTHFLLMESVDNSAHHGLMGFNFNTEKYIEISTTSDLTDGTFDEFKKIVEIEFDSFSTLYNALYEKIYNTISAGKKYVLYKVSAFFTFAIDMIDWTGGAAPSAAGAASGAAGGGVGGGRRRLKRATRRALRKQRRRTARR